VNLVSEYRRLVPLKEISEKELEKKLLSVKNTTLLIRRYKIQDSLLEKYANTVLKNEWLNISFFQQLSYKLAIKYFDKIDYGLLRMSSDTTQEEKDALKVAVKLIK
jgi:hypothetical protein